MFENELPDGFDYQVNRFKLLKESVIPHENKFEAAFLVSVCSEEKVNDFVKALEGQTGTNFNIAHGKRKQGAKNWKHLLLKCARNVSVQTNKKHVKVTQC